MSNIKIFEEKKVRTKWDADKEDWWFSVVDVVAILTDSDYQTARKYWKVLKGRLNKEGSELVTFCYQLKMQSTDGKYYMTDVLDTKGVLRLVQSVPSPKAQHKRQNPYSEFFAKSQKIVSFFFKFFDNQRKLG